MRVPRAPPWCRALLTLACFGIVQAATLRAARNLALRGKAVFPTNASAVLATAAPLSRAAALPDHEYATSAAALLELEQGEGLAAVFRKTVWIASFSRSGSTTMMDMVQASLPTWKQFGIFEPCHAHDTYHNTVFTAPSAVNGCPNLVRDIARCDFSHIQKLWGWGNPHSKHRHPGYAPHLASSDCKAAQLRVYKTIYINDITRHVVPLLKASPGMKVVYIVRDPRAIHASRLRMISQGTNFRVSHDITQEMCHIMVRNSHVKNPRILRVRFEDWVAQPVMVAKRVYGHAGLKFGPKQHQWVASHFNAAECGGANHSFGTCREDSRAVATKWRTQLPPAELAHFATPICQRALKLFRYPLQ